MTRQQIINEAKRRFANELRRNSMLNVGRAIVPALPKNHYAVFYNGAFQTLKSGSGDYYEGY